ncbi:cytochrome c oxidase assembly protein [Amycolatopsis sp., V23-08]|uniref:Cytochrome c oxidase assembly protein n=1 Tax=Amycolatopsis heterodermiae TaxID=3110235 RepID=A0ABU5RPN8_9PSEU|nr:cytochrome c oxidase assembly protein [Amycolatopsis sp., V23-08]MEA5367839.1 cytochrome c oxidase assembly protein [Amycolatopsis sp., V23-08]
MLHPGVVAAVLGAVVAYETGTGRLRRRGDSWPVARDLWFTAAGLVVLGSGGVPGFTGHMVQHVLLGMVAPLAVVLSCPVTLLLRAAPVRARRRLKRVLASRLAVALVFPPVAALLEASSLWVLYRTGLHAAAERASWLHVVVQLHVFLTGLLFTAALCGLDPVRHRYGPGLRATALVGAAAAHAVLAKTLYLVPPPGLVLAAADQEHGAEVMYYGGDLVEVTLALVIAVQWYVARGRAAARDLRRTAISRQARILRR